MATFDFPINRFNGVLRFKVWDRDPMKPDDYIGKVEIPIDEWLEDHESSPAFPFEGRLNTPFHKMITSKNGTQAGNIELKIGSVPVSGIVMLEVKVLRIGLDMDPICKISFAGKSSSTCRVRNSLKPVWNHKLLLRVHESEANLDVNIDLFDHDKITSSDRIGRASLPLPDLIAEGPNLDPETMIYRKLAITKEEDIPESELQIKGDRLGPECAPVVIVRAQYLPYGALRQMFWRQLLVLYTKSQDGPASRPALERMLLSLGSNPSPETIANFFNGSQERNLTFDEVILRLEDAVQTPQKSL
ncbi:hypothetical protein FRC01_012398, partial [Tulasnella sp. 417]